jgi:hypothetical protein
MDTRDTETPSPSSLNTAENVPPDSQELPDRATNRGFASLKRA